MDSTTSFPAGPGTPTSSPNSSPLKRERTNSIKRLPGKVGKGIRNQFRRISGNFRNEDKQGHLPVVVIDPATLFPTTLSSVKDESPRDSIFKRKRLTSFGRRSGSFSSSSASTSCSTCPECVREQQQRQRQRTVSSPTLIIDHTSMLPMPAPSESVMEIEAESASQAEEQMPLSPPALVQPEIPDPFLHDSDDSGSEGDAASPESPVVSESQQTIIAPPVSAEISLSSPAAVDVSTPLPPTPGPNVDKPVPPPPAQQETPSSESEEEENPDVYLPGLILPSMFLPIPNTDPLTTLLTKYIYPPESRPPRDVTGDYKRNDFHTLVMTNSWRALAKMARDRLVSAEPEDLNLILGLWYIRLACLARLRLFNQTSAECTNLFVVLNAIEPVDARTWVFEKVLPFELEVMYARVKYWSGDHMGYLDALTGLLGKCKAKARKGSKKDDETTRSMWKERAARIALIIASQLVELKDFAAATKLLLPLCNQGPNISTSALRSSIGRIYLQSGEIQAAAYHFGIVADDPEAPEEMKAMNASILAVGEGDWESASEILKGLVERDAENFTAVNNLSVSLLSQGKLKEGIQVLEKALNTSPASVVVEPFLFNLSTLYELRSATAADNKRKLLIEVAKWSGDGLKTTCLKMPTN